MMYLVYKEQDLDALDTAVSLLRQQYYELGTEQDSNLLGRLLPAETVVIKMINKNRRKRLKKTIRHLECMIWAN